MAQRSNRTPPVLLIAETRPTLAAGVKVFLSDIPDIQPVAIMAGFDHVVDYAEHHAIGHILVGQGMNGATPLSELRRLRNRNPSWRLVLLSDAADPDAIMAGVSAGARGLIPTSVDEHEFRLAITRIMSGNLYIPDTTAMNENQRPVRPSRVASSRSQPALTSRQFEVLGVLAQGHSNRQIAQILAISESTVSMHLNAAYFALGVHDRASAASAYSDMDRASNDAHFEWSALKSETRLERQLLQ